VLSPDEITRYARHLMLKEIGGPGQQKLRAARVSLVGAGALGGPCALYLAGAGVGGIELVDDDTVSLSNLQRQIQFATGEIGARKVDALAERLTALNPGVEVVARAQRFVPDMALEGDLIIDACDNFPTRFALNALAHGTGRRLISGAVGPWSGQTAVFASGVLENAPCYQCLVPETPPDAQDCSTIGVVGALTGIIGARMALDALRLITGAGREPSGNLWLFDGLTGESRNVTLRKDPLCPLCNSANGLGHAARPV
jgi:molybdopterin/thiamine biosynthesis adenylyltransferase